MFFPLVPQPRIEPMPDQLLVQFKTAGPAADERLVREYILEAVDRLPKQPDCEGVGFVPAGQKPGVDGLVLLHVVGDADAVVRRERDRWNALLEDGLVEDWTTEEAEEAMITEWGENGTALRTRLDVLAARMSVLVYDEFDEPPDPVDAYPAEADDRASPTGVGWWTLLHLLTLQRGYDYASEVDAYTEGITDGLVHVAQYEGSDIAREKLDEVVALLEDAREDL